MVNLSLNQIYNLRIFYTIVLVFWLFGLLVYPELNKKNLIKQNDKLYSSYQTFEFFFNITVLIFLIYIIDYSNFNFGVKLLAIYMIFLSFVRFISDLLWILRVELRKVVSESTMIKFNYLADLNFKNQINVLFFLTFISFYFMLFN